MRLSWVDEAWDDYVAWQVSDKKKLRRINALIKECMRTPFAGTGKPEALKWDLKGCWSRRIDQEHRLVYRVDGGTLHILSCRYHYE